MCAELLRAAGIDWIRPGRRQWEIDLDGLHDAFPDVLKAGWLHGRVNVEPEQSVLTMSTLGAPHIDTSVILRHSREEVLQSQQRRLFLSHKGASKALVNRYCQALREIGLDPWLLREDARAGDAPPRELVAGMQSSCAAVFLITPEASDEKHLAQEIDLAMAERVARKGRFQIISLSLPNRDGARGKVPPILQSQVYKEPDSELEAFREILRAVPLEVGRATWRA